MQRKRPGAFTAHILSQLDTRTARTKDLGTFKTFVITQHDINTYGRKELIEEIQWLQSQLGESCLEADWIYSFGNIADIRSVRVSRSSLPKLYDITGKTNPRDIMKKSSAVIQSCIDECECDWLVKNYYEKALNSVKNGNVSGGEFDATFGKVLNRIVSNKEPIFQRVLSMELFKDSKEFERKYKSSVCSKLRSACPELQNIEALSMSDNDVLRYFNVLTYSQEFHFIGPLEYGINGRTFSTAGHSTGIVLNTQTLINANITGIYSVKRIVTIENAANFFAQTYSDDVLYILSGGFPSPAEIQLYQQIHTLALKNGATEEHWGDMDFGGIRIFQYIKKAGFPNIKPLRMDATDYLSCLEAGAGYTISKSVMTQLQKMDAGELEPLRQLLVKHGVAFEQESMLVSEKHNL